MINFCNINKKFGNKNVALENINLRIGKGEFVFLVGASGAGKSTLLKLLYREETPNSGQLLLGGRNISRLKSKETPLLRRKMGIIFQDFRLLENLTVAENVEFAMEVLQFKRKQIQELVPKVLQQVGMSHRADYFPGQISGGEKQRAAIARAIVNNPPIILADEPTGNLDPDTSWEIIKLLEDINMRGTTVVVATHDKDIVDSLYKRVVALSNGCIIEDRKGGYCSA